MNIIKVDAQTGHEELLSINEFITECPDISTSPFWAGNLNKTRTKREVHGEDRRRRCYDYGDRPCDSLWQCNGRHECLR